MDAVISDNRWVYLHNLTPDFECVIDSHFSAKDPNSIYIDDSMEQSCTGIKPSIKDCPEPSSPS